MIIDFARIIASSYSNQRRESIILHNVTGLFRLYKAGALTVPLQLYPMNNASRNRNIGKRRENKGVHYPVQRIGTRYRARDNRSGLS
jgi:hypothetical protein